MVIQLVVDQLLMYSKEVHLIFQLLLWMDCLQYYYHHYQDHHRMNYPVKHHLFLVVRVVLHLHDVVDLPAPEDVVKLRPAP